MENAHVTLPVGLDHASCYRALAARDARYDGTFFTGVKTTGIYCRPVCPARTPRVSACTFFGSAAAAEAAGFRPCLRCRPELAPYALQQNLAYAVWQRIAAGALNDAPLEHLAEEIGLSSRQVRRVLVEHFGVTPVELAQTQRLLFAKKLLQETSLPMAVVADASGFGSVRRFNALFMQRYRMAPGALRAVGRRDRRAPDAGGTLTVRLAYRPPFDWSALLGYLRPRLAAGVEAVEVLDGDPTYLRSVRLGSLEGWLRVRNDAARRQLCVEIDSALAPQLMPLTARVRELFDLDANPHAIHAHLAGDPLLQAALSSGAVPRLPGAFEPFELAVRAVLGQQVSVAAATTLVARLVQRFGDPVSTPFNVLSHHFPSAQTLAGITVQELAAIGLPLRRAASLQALAAFAAQGGLQAGRTRSLEEALALLCALPGIGPWTASYIAMRALRFPDAFPAGDLGLRKAAALDARALEARSQHWSPWRGYAAMSLWMLATDERTQ